MNEQTADNRVEDGASLSLNEVPELDEEAFGDIDRELDDSSQDAQAFDRQADSAPPEEEEDPTPTAEELEAADRSAGDEQAEPETGEEVDEETLPARPEDAMSPEQAAAEFQRRYAESRAKALEELASQYSLDEETIAEFETNPGAVLPKLAARIALDTVQTVVATVQQQMPGMLQQYQTRSTAERQFTEKFFDSWPDLKDASALPTVRRVGELYRRQNPNASPDEYIREVGAMAMVSLRRQPKEQPSAPQIPGPEAVPGRGSPAASRPAAQNASSLEQTFAQFDEEFDVEDFT